MLRKVCSRFKIEAKLQAVLCKFIKKKQFASISYFCISFHRIIKNKTALIKDLKVVEELLFPRHNTSTGYHILFTAGTCFAKSKFVTLVSLVMSSCCITGQMEWKRIREERVWKMRKKRYEISGREKKKTRKITY